MYFLMMTLGAKAQTTHELAYLLNNIRNNLAFSGFNLTTPWLKRVDVVEDTKLAPCRL